jgi:hypothetical protein
VRHRPAQVLDERRAVNADRLAQLGIDRTAWAA